MVAEAMHTYPREHTLTGGKVVYDIDLSAIANFMSYLRPSNCLVFVKHQGRFKMTKSCGIFL